MKTIALRDLQHKGLKAVSSLASEPVLLETRQGPAYFMVPADQNKLEIQYLELERAMALSNLRKWHNRSEELGLDKLTLDDINQEINELRKK